MTIENKRWYALNRHISNSHCKALRLHGVLEAIAYLENDGGCRNGQASLIYMADDLMREIVDDLDAPEMDIERAIPAGLAAGNHSPLRALHDQWRVARDTYNRSDALDGTPEGVALFDRIMEIEQQAADYEPQTVEDFAFKIIIADSDGDMNVTDYQVELANVAYRIAGIDQVRRGEVA